MERKNEVIYKSINELPKDIYDKLYQLNNDYADKYYNGHIMHEIENYGNIVVKKLGIFTIYGSLPEKFGKPEQFSHIKFIQMANCFVVYNFVNGNWEPSIVKNRWGFTDDANLEDSI